MSVLGWSDGPYNDDSSAYDTDSSGAVSLDPNPCRHIVYPRLRADHELVHALNYMQGVITEDEGSSAEKEVQNLTDKYIAHLDAHLEKKEKEILTV